MRRKTSEKQTTDRDMTTQCLLDKFQFAFHHGNIDGKPQPSKSNDTSTIPANIYVTKYKGL